MLVVVPVSEHDSGISEEFCRAINFFAPYGGHRLLLVARPSDRMHALLVHERLQRAGFDSCEVYLFEKDGPSGWPEGPNYYWRETVAYLKKQANNTPWFWMELDTTPIEDGWLDLLQAEYDQCGKPCLGVLQQNVGVDTKHLVGVAVYPPRLDKICDSWDSCTSVRLAFDVWCQGELVPQSAASKVLCHFFRTEDYRCTNMGLCGIDKSARPNGVRYDGVIPREAVIVHGCMDGSLARLIAPDWL